MTIRWEKCCYYCGEKANSREHLPAKQLFKAFDCDSITVPSCDAHNTAKSSRDQAIASAFLLPMFNRSEGSYPTLPALNSDILKAVEGAAPGFERSKRYVTSQPLADGSYHKWDLPDSSWIDPSIKISTWMRQLTAGLVYHGTRLFDSSIKWDDPEVTTSWSPDFYRNFTPEPIPDMKLLEEMETNNSIRATLNELQWAQGWSATPRPYPHGIYQFHIHFGGSKSPMQANEVVFRHHFYNAYSWYVGFSTSRGIVNRLMKKVLQARPSP